jgi:hypothetical protein
MLRAGQDTMITASPPTALQATSLIEIVLTTGTTLRVDALPSGVRVWLACGHTDMRNYAEFPVMRSSPAKRRSRWPFSKMVEPNRSA